MVGRKERTQRERHPLLITQPLSQRLIPVRVSQTAQLEVLTGSDSKVLNLVFE